MNSSYKRNSGFNVILIIHWKFLCVCILSWSFYSSLPLPSLNFSTIQFENAVNLCENEEATKEIFFLRSTEKYAPWSIIIKFYYCFHKTRGARPNSSDWAELESGSSAEGRRPRLSQDNEHVLVKFFEISSVREKKGRWWLENFLYCFH